VAVLVCKSTDKTQTGAAINSPKKLIGAVVPNLPETEQQPHVSAIFESGTLKAALAILALE
jgi:hypothetical protein